LVEIVGSQESVVGGQRKRTTGAGRQGGSQRNFDNLFYINDYFVDGEYCFVKQIQYVLQNIRKYSRCVPFI